MLHITWFISDKFQYIPYNIGIPMAAKTWLSDTFQYITCYTDGA